ncbi:unnamed protein product [Linum tenue]|uniref:Uncharacterized protein n=1 Tax=Linum tenue TaxID=586396 RepID=A0AAV0QI72_9ROSI|nr:unnamed protein product [Linum tenue]
MGSLSEEEFRFFDAADDIASTQSLGDINSAASSPRYALWADAPKSVEERRNMFLKWMEVEGSCPDGDLPSPGGSGINRMIESSGAVLRNSCYEGEFCSTRSSSSILLEELGSAQELVGRDGNSGGGLASNVDETRARECSSKASGSLPSSLLQLQPNCERSNDSSTSSSTASKADKKRWLSRLRSMACAVDGRTQAERMSHSVDDSLLYRTRRVKVRQSGKQVKELSALYSGQDIQAHRGSILAMKFSPDGQYLASAGEDGIVRVWQVLEDDRSNERDIPEIDPSCIYFTVDHLSELKPLISNQEKTVKMRSLRKTSDSACVIFPPKVFRILEDPLHEFVGHSGDILDLSWSNDSGLIVGSMTGTCRLYNRTGLRNTANHVSARFTSDGKNIISACEDANVYMWDSFGLEDSFCPNGKNIKSCERFSADASVALPWSGFKKSWNSENGESLPFSSPASFNLGQEYYLESYPKGSATWPEEKLPRSSPSSATPLASMHKSQYKFLKASCQSTAGSHAWGLVIVTAGWDGRIRSYHSYGLPVPT